EEKIISHLEQWSNQGAALVLTVGGSGLGPRDHTPEATRHVIEREAPGLAEAMRAMGAERNPFAWLSRGIAGLKGNTLIINLPGSRRGAEESLSSILALVRHGLEVAAGSQSHP
ncbi:MAG: molybdopterin-binding protein, partial [Terracidiphilus sp.]